jgi:penicillin amidase
MFWCVLASTFLVIPGEILRDAYGIPHIFAPDLQSAFHYAGYAVAQDRLYQMDISRRLALGNSSELLGNEAVASDKEAIRFGYSHLEYTNFYNQLNKETQNILVSYSNGINAYIDDAYSQGKLPVEYSNQKPKPWEPIDSLAIAVNLTRRFGRGGAGEIRNLLLYTYLENRLKDRTLDAFDDLLWENDAASIPTCSTEDDPFKGISPFLRRDRDVLVSHLKLIPKVTNLFELLPGIRIEEETAMRALAEQHGITYRAGSYAILVSSSRSSIGVPLLLSAPQMGFSAPSVIHQMSIHCPEYSAVGMNLPGLPGILVGHSEFLAWGVTSGVADTDDIFFVKLNPNNPNQYEYQGQWKDFEIEEVIIRSRDGQSETGLRERSIYGPVVLRSSSQGVAYVRKSTLWMSETDWLGGITAIASAKSIDKVKQLSFQLNANFNLFVATSEGDIGWFFCGRIPLRSPKVDPRLPTPGDGNHDWIGVLAAEKMPYVINPKQGYIANWNNKPVSWWPNFDTPVWGRIFRNQLITDRLDEINKITVQDIESIVRSIATHFIEPNYFLSTLNSPLQRNLDNVEEKRSRAYLRDWNAEYRDGAIAPVIYNAWFDAFREQMFSDLFGNFIAPDNFRLVVQPTFTWNAVHSKTKIDYLNGRKVEDIAFTAFQSAISALSNRRGTDVATWRFSASRMPFINMPSVLYTDRGTYIQIVELWPQIRGRYIAPPGISELPASPNYLNQAALAANWAYIPMLIKREEISVGR